VRAALVLEELHSKGHAKQAYWLSGKGLGQQLGETASGICGFP